jgi:hypothetical protein
MFVLVPMTFRSAREANAVTSGELRQSGHEPLPGT